MRTLIPDWVDALRNEQDYKKVAATLKQRFNQLPRKKTNNNGVSYAWKTGLKIIIKRYDPAHTLTKGSGIEMLGSYTVYSLSPTANMVHQFGHNAQHETTYTCHRLLDSDMTELGSALGITTA